MPKIAKIRPRIAEEQVREHVGVGGDVAGPGLVVGVGVGLGIDAREEGQHPVEGQTQEGLYLSTW